MCGKPKPPRLILAAAATLLLVTAWGGRPAGANSVELELILAVDASFSVDSKEFALQVAGLANAFRDPRVVTAIRSSGDLGIAVSLVQWAGPGEQRQAVDWSHLTDGASAAMLAERITRMGRAFSGYGTSITAALEFSTELFFTNRFFGRRKIIDVSGDGADNRGPVPELARDTAVILGITVNGLAIENEQPNLAFYYRQRMIGGTGAFVMAIDDYGDFADAIVHKLIREIGEAPMAQAPGGATGSPQTASKSAAMP